MSTLPVADVRGYYRALAIELAGWAQEAASVACFGQSGRARAPRSVLLGERRDRRVALLGVRRQRWRV